MLVVALVIVALVIIMFRPSQLDVYDNMHLLQFACSSAACVTMVIIVMEQPHLKVLLWPRQIISTCHKYLRRNQYNSFFGTC